MTIRSGILFTVSLAAAAACLAGPLNPPAGPIASTHKTLTEVEPRTILNTTNTPGDADSTLRISVGGSYKVAGNLSTSAGRSVIEIDADNVTLDLNGYPVRGNTGNDAIRVVAGRSRVTIRNGTVFASGGAGINASGAAHVRIENVSVTNCTGDGVSVGNHGMVIGVTVDTCAVGILAGEDCVIAGCTVQGNTVHGIDAGQGGTVRDCTAVGNTQRGIYHRGRGSIASSHARSNGQEGIRGENATTVENCTSSENTGRGFYLTLNANIRGCSTWQNGADGIVVGNHSIVSRCNSTNNTGVGIQATSASSVLDCVASSNTLDGIRVFGESIVARNNCSFNGFSTANGSGIRVSTDNNRVEDNNCSHNAPHGIHVDAANNLIIRNTCTNSTGANYNIVASNAVGTITNVAGAAITTTNPFANFEY